MTPNERLSLMRAVVSEMAQAHTTTVLCMSRLQELLTVDADIPVASKVSLPRTDTNNCCVYWGRKTCHLGHTKSFCLFARLLRRADSFVPYEHLLRDVWQGDSRSYETVRSAVRQLKTKLAEAGMRGLADRIRGEGKHYVLQFRR